MKEFQTKDKNTANEKIHFTKKLKNLSQGHFLNEMLSLAHVKKILNNPNYDKLCKKCQIKVIKDFDSI